MSNPFENADGTYLVLTNDEGQYSLWPEHIAVPEGWTVTFGPDSRSACVDHVDENWVDMRPRSLAEQMGQR